MTEQSPPQPVPEHDLPAAADVVVVGAGLAGLACARQLSRRGIDVVVLEASDGPGGRVRSDVVGGFICDRGFQLLNPAYPEVRRVLDVAALRLQPFPAAVVVAGAQGRQVLADPRRSPGLLPLTAVGLLRERGGTWREQAAFARWALEAARADPRKLLSEPDLPWVEALSRRGVSGALRRRVLEPFLAGVVGEDDGVTSHQFVQLLVRSFVRGTPSVPWRGMRAVPEQLAAQVPGIHHGVRVESAGPGLVRSSAGDIQARAVVVATDPRSASALLDLPPVVSRGLTTYWHVAPEPPTRSGALHVDGDRRGPVVNTVVISNRARSYSPDERALIATTVLGGNPDLTTERAVTTQLAQIYGQPTHWWELIRRDAIPEALTAMPVPLQVRQPVALGEGMFVAGDHRDTASIQGALVSGRRTADAVLAELGLPAVPREPIKAG
ncbi:NAD(P)/FAD-dependent oxidoreductase [Kineosporia succinea]|uniref:Phytoene dehydrogenase-like protein n=1 Tax=Kineosporia succinea TaxID=84632 RepID=A0ABT9P852_9ACTN|nr:NAD(P)/FAD-dependent oxidoreductase [Kineosporia succinea]MDP9828200.1 phytoene dehydrogenase-like protein [Kineosporia succinea]